MPEIEEFLGILWSTLIVQQALIDRGKRQGTNLCFASPHSLKWYLTLLYGVSNVSQRGKPASARNNLPGGNESPFRRASAYTVESAALPSQLLNTYVNFMSKSHMASTFCETPPFLSRYLATALSGTYASKCEPSIAPWQSLKYGKK